MCGNENYFRSVYFCAHRIRPSMHSRSYLTAFWLKVKSFVPRLYRYRYISSQLIGISAWCKLCLGHTLTMNYAKTLTAFTFNFCILPFTDLTAQCSYEMLNVHGFLLSTRVNGTECTRVLGEILNLNLATRYAGSVNFKAWTFGIRGFLDKNPSVFFDKCISKLLLDITMEKNVSYPWFLDFLPIKWKLFKP